MLPELLIAACLLALTVLIHASGLAAVLGRLPRASRPIATRFWPVAWLLVRVAWALIVLHLAEIAAWAIFYWWAQALPDLETAFYFSGVTYTTLGYGDVVLPMQWRLLGPMEGLTGILMCGLSTGFFFVIVSKVFAAKTEPAPR
jgi:Ion channel